MLVQRPHLQQLGKRAFATYLKSVYLQKDKKVFDLSRFSAEKFAAYAASLGLPVTPTIRFISHKKNVSKKDMEDIDNKHMKSSSKPDVIANPQVNSDLTMDDEDDDILYPKKPNADAIMDGLDDVLRPKVPSTDTDTKPEEVTEYVSCNSSFKLFNILLPYEFQATKSLVQVMLMIYPRQTWKALKKEETEDKCAQASGNKGQI